LTRPQCALGRLIPSTPDVERIKRDAWHADGWLVVHVDDERLSWDQQEYVRQIGDKINGKAKR
jgi:hypothetical protein